MSDVPIPEDIRESALAVVARGFIQEGLIDAVAQALMAERSRCAKIAEVLIEGDAPNPRLGYASPDYHAGYSSAATDIAAAIRRGTP